jgi:hypothetical protein
MTEHALPLVEPVMTDQIVLRDDGRWLLVYEPVDHSGRRLVHRYDLDGDVYRRTETAVFAASPWMMAKVATLAGLPKPAPIITPRMSAETFPDDESCASVMGAEEES